LLWITQLDNSVPNMAQFTNTNLHAKLIYNAPIKLSNDWNRRREPINSFATTRVQLGM